MFIRQINQIKMYKRKNRLRKAHNESSSSKRLFYSNYIVFSNNCKLEKSVVKKCHWIWSFFTLSMSGDTF